MRERENYNDGYKKGSTQKGSKESGTEKGSTEKGRSEKGRSKKEVVVAAKWGR
jgi:hypothetical protein